MSKKTFELMTYQSMHGMACLRKRSEVVHVQCFDDENEDIEW